MGSGPSRRIFAGFLIVSAVSLASRGLTAVRELVTAHRFGRGDELDGFLTAQLLPLLIVNLVVASAQQVSIPRMIELVGEPAQARGYLRRCVLGGLAISLLAMGVLQLASAPVAVLLAPGYAPSKLESTTAMLRQMALLIPVMMTSGLLQIQLMARERFVMGGIAPLAGLACAIFCILATPEPEGEVLVRASLVGAVVELLVVAIIIRSDVAVRNGASIPGSTLQVLWSWSPMLLGQLIQLGTTVVELAFATRQENGSVSAWGYATRLFALPQALFAASLSTAALPVLSRLLAEGRLGEFRTTVLKWVGIAAGAGALAALLIALFAGPAISVFLVRGRFTSEDGKLVADLLSLYAFSMPFLMPGLILVRAIGALQCSGRLALVACTSLVVCIVMNLLLAPPLGIRGIPLSSVAMYFSALLGLAVLLWQGYRKRVEMVP